MGGLCVTLQVNSFVSFGSKLAHLNFHVTTGEPRNLISIPCTYKRYFSSLERPDQLLKPPTLIVLTWTKWRAPTNASKWRMGFNSAFKGLTVPLFLKLRRTGLETDHSFPSSDVIKNSGLMSLWRVYGWRNLVRTYLWVFAENEGTLHRKCVVVWMVAG